MDTTQAIVLALAQGITEFLPISSSGHLILLPNLFGWEDQGLAFDVAVHVGSLLAVLIYFREQIVQIVIDTTRHSLGGKPTEQSRLGWFLVLATIPVGLVGLLLGDWIELTLRDPKIIGLAMIIFAPILWWVDRHNTQQRDLNALNWRDALVIGCAQAIAIIPGVSRSGMTIIAGLFLGLNREHASRFSFLMAIPVIILAGGLKTIELMQSDIEVDWRLLLLGVVVSGVSALVCIHWFLAFIRRFSMAVFAVYLLFFGVFIWTLFS